MLGYLQTICWESFAGSSGDPLSSCHVAVVHWSLGGRRRLQRRQQPCRRALRQLGQRGAERREERGQEIGQVLGDGSGSLVET